MFKRPDEFRFSFTGLNTNDPPDALKPGKSPYAVNVRGVMGGSVRTRPGYTQVFIGKDPITDIRAYAALSTDDAPRLLARDSANKIWLDNGVIVGAMAGSSQGACMIPYRPNQSPQPWMYVATAADYQKFSAPDALNVVVERKVGIREPSAPPNVSPLSFNYFAFSPLAVGWLAGGTAGVIADNNRVTDTATAVFVDPASNSKRYSVQVAANKSYQIGELINIVKAGGGSFNTVIEDVLPPINAGTELTIKSIYYYTGTAGRCVIVPTQMPADPTVPTYSDNTPASASIFDPNTTLSGLRRGGLVKLSTGAEVCMILSVTSGPDGTTAFEVSTSGTHSAGETVTGIPAIIVSDIDATVVGQAITSVYVASTLTGAGTGTLTQALIAATNPFVNAMPPSNVTPQPDDYVCFGLQLDDMSKLVQGTIIFDIGNAGADYTTETLYYIFNVSNIINPPDQSPLNTLDPNGPGQPIAWSINGTVFDNYQDAVLYAINLDLLSSIVPIYGPNPTPITALTPLPSSQWSTVLIPIRALIRNGNDLTRSLANCQGVRISLQTTGTVTVGISSLWVGGGNQPDVANNAPYFYCFRGRSTATGAVGNPSPVTRYGVSPRRQAVRVEITDTTGDAQVDVFDVFRYGGTVTSWRSIGTVLNTGSPVIFTDNFFDDAALSGQPLDYDNFEPWPTIDVPFSILAGTVGAITTTIQARGTCVLVIWSSAAPFTNPAPSTILRWLPGTTVLLSGADARTLWTRPSYVTLTSPPAAFCYAYLFQLVENVSYTSPASFQVLEPNVANQILPYVFGPNAQGDLFACGDPLRPGTLYFCKSYNPDSAPDTNNIEITNPSEPLLGGEMMGGYALVASSKRWWGIYPSYNIPSVSALTERTLVAAGQKYDPVERQVGRGLVSPYGHCTDGKLIYFWAKDGIWATDGSTGMSITDPDLYNIFPHEGVQGHDYYYKGQTVYAPSYDRASEFRLGICNGFLYADYRDGNDTPRTLVYDIALKAWCVDEYADPVAIHYGVEQQESTLLTSTPPTYAMLAMGHNSGVVSKSVDLTNDNGTAITCKFATLEFNGGDARADQNWNDSALDSTPMSAITVTPVANGAGIVGATVVPAAVARSRTIINVNATSKFLGLFMQWTDDFTLITTPTTLFLWQPLAEPLPISVLTWKPEGTGFGLKGYKHLYRILSAYRSIAPVTLTFTTYDGTSPSVITLPSTGGAYQKVIFLFTPNKGLLYFLTASSQLPWQPYLDEWEIHVGQWGRQGSYSVFKDFPTPVGVG